MRTAPPIAPLLDPVALEALGRALTGYTVAGVGELIGPIGRAALDRGDLAGVRRAIRAVDDPLATLIRLFVLGDRTSEQQARRALHPVELDAAASLIEVSAGVARAVLDVRPHAQAGGGDERDWWVVSDFAAEVRGGPLAADHVLGIGQASLTLAQATPRARVDRALDIGTGCGVQALHLSTHAARVVGTDISTRALRMAATTAALSGVQWDLRAGSFAAPVAGESFDLVVANPPFVVSPGRTRHEYRDSGVAGDGATAALVGDCARLLGEGGTAQLLANWIVDSDGDWRARVHGWLESTGCDAWVWQRELADPGEYVALWLRDAGHAPGTPEWDRQYDAWLDWFAEQGVAAVGMGLITLWNRARDVPLIVLDDVPQAYESPIGAEIDAWQRRAAWLAATSDPELLAAPLSADRDLVHTRADLLADGQWATRRATLRQSHGMRWEVEIDDAVARLVAACDAGAPVGVALDLLAASVGDDSARVEREFVPVLRDLLQRGLLRPDLPADAGRPAAPQGTPREGTPRGIG